MYECIIFDIDGTMTDSEKAVRLSLALLMEEEFGRKFDPDELEFSFGIPGVDSLRALGFSRPEETDRKWTELFLAHFDLVHLFDGMEQLVRALKGRGVRLGIVTSKTRQEYIQEFETPFNNISSLFETYVCADDTELHKPYPDPMLECLRKMGVPSERALYIGDTVYDFRCARDAGAKFALAMWGASTQEGITARHFPEKPMDLFAEIFPQHEG